MKSGGIADAPRAQKAASPSLNGSSKGWSPGRHDERGIHVLRHTFCSHLAMRGAGARAIQELAGHRDLVTTQRYMHVSPAAIESAIRLLDSPPLPPSRGDILETERTAG